MNISESINRLTSYIKLRAGKISFIILKKSLFNFKNHLIIPKVRIRDLFYCTNTPLFTQGILGNLVIKCTNVKHAPIFSLKLLCNLGDYIPDQILGFRSELMIDHTSYKTSYNNSNE